MDMPIVDMTVFDCVVCGADSDENIIKNVKTENNSYGISLHYINAWRAKCRYRSFVNGFAN